MNHYTEEIRNDVNALANDTRALMADTGHLAGEKAAQARQRLSAALESAQEVYGRMRQRTMGTVKAADQIIRDHPYQAAAIALGIGAILGFLLTRPKNGASAADTDKCEKDH